MKNLPVRWAILGAGKIARKFASDFKSVNNAVLIGIAARHPERAKAFAEEYDIPKVFSYEELYASNAVDVVYISTTHNFHFDQSRECLLHGKAVLCEKPVTINDKEFLELQHLARKKGLFFMEAMWTYFLPAIIKAKEWWAQGRIGKLTTIQACFGFPMPVEPEGRMYNPLLAGGALLDLGVYPIAFATYITGQKPGRILASGKIGSTGVDERVSMIFEYEDMSAHLSASMVARMSNTACLYGDEGYIMIPDFFKACSAILYDPYGNILETFADDRHTLGYSFEIQEATDCMLNGATESSIVPHARSLQLQEMMTEVRRQIGLKYPGEE